MSPRFLFPVRGLPAVLVLLMSGVGGLEARTFTDRQGRKIEAEITAVSGSNVTLRLTNGKSYTIPVSRLSDADQLFIELWEEDGEKAAPGDGEAPNDPAAPVPSNINYSIEIEAEKERLAKGKTEENSMGEVTPEDWIFVVALGNRSGVELEGLEMSYRIYVDPEATAKLSPLDPPKFHGFRTKLETLADRATVKLKTEKVVLNELELSPDYVFSDGSRNDLEDSLEGIWIKIWHGGRKVAEYQSGRSTVKKAEWPDDEPAQPEENPAGAG